MAIELIATLLQFCNTGGCISSLRARACVCHRVCVIMLYTFFLLVSPVCLKNGSAQAFVFLPRGDLSYDVVTDL